MTNPQNEAWLPADPPGQPPGPVAPAPLSGPVGLGGPSPEQVQRPTVPPYPQPVPAHQVVPYAQPYPPAGYPTGPNVVHHVHHGIGSKDTTVALLLWFFLGAWGVDQFYLGRTGAGIGVIALNVAGWLTVWIFVGFLLWFALFVWWVVNGCLTPGRVQAHNARLASY